MKIAIDLRAMDGASRYRGIGLYIQNLLNHMLEGLAQDHKVTLYVYDPSSLSDINQAALDSCTIITVKPSSFSKLPNIFSKLFGGILPREYKRGSVLKGVGSCDVFFQPYHEMGIPKSVEDRSVVVGYDLIPLIFNDEFFNSQKPSINPKKLLLYVRQKAQAWAYRGSLEVFNRAQHILAISNNTKQTFVDNLGVTADKIEVIYLAVPTAADTEIGDDFRAKIDNKRYVAYVGGIDSRRPILRLLKQAKSIHKSLGLQLFVAGKDFETSRDVNIIDALKAGEANGDLVNLGRLTDAEKDMFLSNAYTIVYPTFYEGFGLPILEGFNRGVPVITMNNSSIPEVAGDAAIYIDSVDQLEEKLQLLSDPSVRNDFITKGQQQAKQFSWQQCANETRAALEKVSNAQ